MKEILREFAKSEEGKKVMLVGGLTAISVLGIAGLSIARRIRNSEFKFKLKKGEFEAEFKNPQKKDEADRVEVYYMDDEGNTVPKDRATRANIRELDASGNLLLETFGRIKGDAE